MICVKILKGAQELQMFLNVLGWQKVLQVLPSEYYLRKPGDSRQIGAISVTDSDKIIRESTYTVIFEDDIDLDELTGIQKGVSADSRKKEKHTYEDALKACVASGKADEILSSEKSKLLLTEAVTSAGELTPEWTEHLNDNASKGIISKYIKIEDACEQIYKSELLTDNNKDWAVEAINQVPVADVEPIIYATKGLHVGDKYYCSNCRQLVHCVNYCEICGAKIDKE